MTLEELWELFPIVLVAHSTQWKEWADDEIALLHKLLSAFSPEIHHIGSTAIPGIIAKPIADILVLMQDDVNWGTVKTLMESNGYICMHESDARMSFNKGYTLGGYAERVFHIHFHRQGDDDEIAFRDYLMAHPCAAKEYEALKRSLLLKFGNDRDGYTAAKTDFVNHILALTKRAGG